MIYRVSDLELSVTSLVLSGVDYQVLVTIWALD